MKNYSLFILAISSFLLISCSSQKAYDLSDFGIKPDTKENMVVKARSYLRTACMKG